MNLLKNKAFKVTIFAVTWALSILLTVMITMNIFEKMASPMNGYSAKTVDKQSYSQLVKVERDGVSHYTYYFADGSSVTDTYTETTPSE